VATAAARCHDLAGLLPSNKMLEDPFVLIEPEEDSPVLVEVPHAGLWLDAEAAAWTNVPVRCLPRDADLYVHELFANAPRLGATYLYARISRYLVDLNRGEDDYDGQAVQGGRNTERPRGVIWRLSSDGIPVLRQRLPIEEYRRRMAHFHRPYHEAIAQCLERKRARFGFSVLICGHSMPSPRMRSLRSTPALADIVPGSRGRTSASGPWIDVVDEVAKGCGFRVQHDVPYRGGFSTGHYGRPGEGWHAVQIEIARRLYMDEQRLGRSPGGFAKVKQFADDVVARTVEAARHAALAAQ